MTAVNRKTIYKLYPNKSQAKELWDMLVLHQRLYNACLQQRIEAYQRQEKKLRYDVQCQELTILRREIAGYANLSRKSCEVTLKRIDLAFEAFFRRLERGQKPGFPRFKAIDRFPSFGFRTHGNGWKFTPRHDWKHGKLYIKGISGEIKCRGRARTPGEVKTCQILHRDGLWHLAVSIKCEPERKCGTAAAGLDWGVATYATLVHSNGTEKIDNQRFLKNAEQKLRREQRALSRKKRGSSNRRRQRLRFGRLQRKLMNGRLDFEHQFTKRLVDQYGRIATEELDVNGVTGSAKGDAANRGKNVKVKAGLNRAILDISPATFLAKLRYKMEEAGGEVLDVPTRTVKPSQTCPACGHKEVLSESTHRCRPCGRELRRLRRSATPGT
jgi:putative transposase